VFDPIPIETHNK